MRSVRSIQFAALSLCAGMFALGATSIGTGQAAPPRPMCAASQLSFGFDDEGGMFNGMSQSGTLLVLRNIGTVPCQVQALPDLHFVNAEGHAMNARRRAPRGMHPGPVLPPVLVMSGAELTARLHWVSGDVYDGHNCISPALAVLDLPEGALRQPFERHLCAPANETQFFDQAPLRPDPTPPSL